MEKEFYVPFSIAKKLNDIGYDECSDMMYENDETLCERYRGQCIEAPSYDEVIEYLSKYYNTQVGLNIYPFPNYTYEYSAYIINRKTFKSTKHYKTRKEAYNEAFETILDNIINNNEQNI